MFRRSARVTHIDINYFMNEANVYQRHIFYLETYLAVENSNDNNTRVNVI